jgi:streptomycin 6-kinase
VELSGTFPMVCAVTGIHHNRLKLTVPDLPPHRLRGVGMIEVPELADEGGDRLLHWDLHYENVLAGTREAWLAIDPNPLAGDPGFDLMPALDNRWDGIVATGDVARAVRWRFDLMVDVLGLERRRSAGWTLGRVLQNTLWDAEDGEPEMGPVQLAIARALLPYWS